MLIKLKQDLELSLAPDLAPEPLAAGLVIDLPRATAERLVASRVADRAHPDDAAGPSRTRER